MTGVSCVSTGSVSMSNWTHVSVTVDTFNNKVDLYMNGILDSSHDYQIADKNITLTDTITIGTDPFNNYFSGSMYQTSLHYGKFSANKIKSLSYDVHLICGYSFDEINTINDVTYFEDIGSNALNAMIEGTPKLNYPGIIEFNKSVEFLPNNFLKVDVDGYNLENMSVSMWIHQNNVSVFNGTLVYLDDRLALKVISTNQLNVNGINVTLNSNLFSGIDEWSFVVLTLSQFYDTLGALQTNANIYIDGVLDSLTIINTSLPSRNEKMLYIGYDTDSTYLTGKVDHFMLHSGVLSADDIMRFYNTFIENKAYNGKHVKAGYWNHVAASFNNSTNTVGTFLNGLKFREYPNYNVSPSTGQTNILVGKNDTEYYEGAMDDLRIFKFELPEIDVHTIFETKNPEIIYQVAFDSTQIDEASMTVSYTVFAMDDIPRQYVGVFLAGFAETSTDADMLAMLVANTYPDTTLLTSDTNAGTYSHTSTFTKAITSATSEDLVSNTNTYTVKLFITDATGYIMNSV